MKQWIMCIAAALIISSLSLAGHGGLYAADPPRPGPSGHKSKDARAMPLESRLRGHPTSSANQTRNQDSPTGRTCREGLVARMRPTIPLRPGHSIAHKEPTRDNAG